METYFIFDELGTRKATIKANHSAEAHRIYAGYSQNLMRCTICVNKNDLDTFQEQISNY